MTQQMVMGKKLRWLMGPISDTLITDFNLTIQCLVQQQPTGKHTHTQYYYHQHHHNHHSSENTSGNFSRHLPKPFLKNIDFNFAMMIAGSYGNKLNQYGRKVTGYWLEIYSPKLGQFYIKPETYFNSFVFWCGPMLSLYLHGLHDHFTWLIIREIRRRICAKVWIIFRCL